MTIKSFNGINGILVRFIYEIEANVLNSNTETQRERLENFCAWKQHKHKFYFGNGFFSLSNFIARDWCVSANKIGRVGKKKTKRFVVVWLAQSWVIRHTVKLKEPTKPSHIICERSSWLDLPEAKPSPAKQSQTKPFITRSSTILPIVYVRITIWFRFSSLFLYGFFCCFLYLFCMQQEETKWLGIQIEIM